MTVVMIKRIGLFGGPLLIIACTLGASSAYMMPVGKPPNAIVFGTGLVQMPQMMKAGIWLNLSGILVITAFRDHRVRQRRQWAGVLAVIFIAVMGAAGTLSQGSLETGRCRVRGWRKLVGR